MTDSIDIRPDHMKIVQEILRAHLPSDAKAWAFGSRATWTSRVSSDLDLAIESGQPLHRKVLLSLAIAFEDSMLPYTVDVLDINSVREEFKQIVEAQKVLLPIQNHVSDSISEK